MFMDPIRERQLLLTRRHFFGRMATGIGVAALGSLLNPALFEALADETGKSKGLLGLPHFTPKARRVIYLFMAGGPDRKSTRLNSSHSQISYAVFCLEKKKAHIRMTLWQEIKTLKPSMTAILCRRLEGTTPQDIFEFHSDFMTSIVRKKLVHILIQTVS